LFFPIREGHVTAHGQALLPFALPPEQKCGGFQSPFPVRQINQNAGDEALPLLPSRREKDFQYRDLDFRSFNFRQLLQM